MPLIKQVHCNVPSCLPLISVAYITQHSAHVLSGQAHVWGVL